MPEAAAQRGYTPTRSPIVLIHGLLGFDQIGPLECFNNVAEALESGGATVFTTHFSALNWVGVLTRARGYTPSSAAIRWVTEGSGGHPGLVVELSRACESRPTGHDTSLPLPAQLHEPARARLAECSAPCQNLVRVAAVVGTPGSCSLLRSPAACPSDAFVDALEEAETAKRPGSSGGVCCAQQTCWTRRTPPCDPKCSRPSTPSTLSAHTSIRRLAGLVSRSTGTRDSP